MLPIPGSGDWLTQPTEYVGLDPAHPLAQAAAAAVAPFRQTEPVRGSFIVRASGVSIAPSRSGGVVFQGSNFNGSIDFGAGGGLDKIVPIGTPFVIWVRATVTVTGVRQALVADHASSGLGESVCLEVTAANQVRFYIGTGAGSGTTSTVSGEVLAGTVTAGTHDFVAVYQRGVGNSVYLDGVPLGSAAFTGDPRVGIALRVGSFGALLTQFGFRGQIHFAHIFRGDVATQVLAARNTPYALFEPAELDLLPVDVPAIAYSAATDDSVAPSDAAASALGASAAASESAIASDACSAVLSAAAASAESAVIADVALGAASTAAICAETAAVVDAVDSTVAAAAVVSEAASAVDAPEGQAAAQASIGESVAVGDAADGLAVGEYSATLAEAASVTSANDAALAATAATAESSAIADAASGLAVGEYASACVEAAAATDAAAVSITAAAALAEAASVTGASVGTRAMQAAQEEAASVGDGSSVAYSAAVATADAMMVTDAATALRATFADVLETATPIDAGDAFRTASFVPSLARILGVAPEHRVLSVAPEYRVLAVTPDRRID